MNRISFVTVVLMMSTVVIILSTTEASAIPEPDNGRSYGRSSCACPRMYDPICASNGVTYGNECTYLCAARKKSDLTIVKRDACDAEYGIWEDIPYNYRSH